MEGLRGAETGSGILRADFDALEIAVEPYQPGANNAGCQACSSKCAYMMSERETDLGRQTTPLLPEPGPTAMQLRT